MGAQSVPPAQASKSNSGERTRLASEPSIRAATRTTDIAAGGATRALGAPTAKVGESAIDIGGPLLARGLAWVLQPTGQRLSATVSRSTILGLQRFVGNAVVAAAMRPLQGSSVQRNSARQPASSGTIQRDDPASVPVTKVTVSAARVSVPPEAGLSLKASAVPGKATGVKFSVEKGSVSPTGVTIDATTGVISVAAAQPGGTVTVKATSDDGSYATSDLQIVEKPTAIAATAASSGGGSTYGGQFTHTFSSPSGQATGLNGANVNEKFDATKATTPFGSFTLAANAAGSHGWDLDSAGTMTGPDNVAIDRSMVDVGKFTKSASNPAPANSLPVGFTMVQHLHAKSLPSGKQDAAPFTDVNHVRTLTDKGTFTVAAGLGHTDDAYTGPAAYTNIKASATSVSASPPKPKGASGGTWAQTKVQVTADAVPGGRAKFFSLVGPKLGCAIDAATGELLIGDKVGTIKVRVAESATGRNFDELSISIVAAPSPTPTPTPGQPKATSQTSTADQVVTE